ncbi:hypothetical protein HMSSN036_45180 [Paenibacillus macerans]|nr:hypothetical protein HMSSN036_45180 [Paenibacillus macerans]
MHLEFRNVSYSYNGVQDVLTNVSFSIDNSDIFCLSGRNGAGKKYAAEITDQDQL